jgi:hypothetical protein
MRRHVIGILALAMLVTAVALWVQGTQEGLAYQVEVNSLRMGSLLAVLWLAYADLYRIPPWLWATFLPMLVIVVLKPRWLIIVLPITFLLAILHPRVWPKGQNRRVR